MPYKTRFARPICYIFRLRIYIRSLRIYIRSLQIYIRNLRIQFPCGGKNEKCGANPVSRRAVKKSARPSIHAPRRGIEQAGGMARKSAQPPARRSCRGTRVPYPDETAFVCPAPFYRARRPGEFRILRSAPARPQKINRQPARNFPSGGGYFKNKCFLCSPGTVPDKNFFQIDE